MSPPQVHAHTCDRQFGELILGTVCVWCERAVIASNPVAPRVAGYTVLSLYSEEALHPTAMPFGSAHMQLNFSHQLASLGAGLLLKVY
jgi:hypothetical protein